LDLGIFEIQPIGAVESSLTDPAVAPKQGSEGAPSAALKIDPAFRQALDGVRPGDRIVVLTWLQLADRETLRVHPRDDPANPMRGVFATRSADRPNPVGLHVTEVVSIEGERVQVSALEAVDGTPIVDLKPVLREE
jgi:tRNA-Thr(GGU) m(6)t(6)A37 methyltransferase TsaA